MGHWVGVMGEKAGQVRHGKGGQAEAWRRGMRGRARSFLLSWNRVPGRDVFLEPGQSGSRMTSSIFLLILF